MENKQLSFFDTENKYERLTKLGDSLERLNEIIDREMVREKLTSVCQKEDYTKGGHPLIDVIIKFKASILKRLYNLFLDGAVYHVSEVCPLWRPNHSKEGAVN